MGQARFGLLREVVPSRSEIVDAVPTDPNHFKGVDQATRRATESMVCVPLVCACRRTDQTRALGVGQILNP